jgi:hypothetical protein
MKRLIVLIALLQLGIIAGAKENSSKEEVNMDITLSNGDLNA